MSHPKGIVPEGNLLFSKNVRKSLMLRYNGLGKFFHRLTDEQIVDLLSFFDAESLVFLSMTSKVFHAFSTVDFIWRDIVLTECDIKRQPIDFDTTWRQTYFRMHSGKDPVFANIRVDGLPSGFLFKQWLCGSIKFERDVPHFFKHQDIPRIPLSEMSVERFVTEFERPNRPVIIRNAVEHWPAMQRWQNDEYLKSVCEKAHKTFRATSAAASRAATFTMPGYLQYATTVKEEAPLYLFERDFALVSELKNDFEVPHFFRQENITLPLSEGTETDDVYVHQPDLFSLLGDGKRPDYRWMVIGPACSGSLFHIDPNMTNAWNVSIRGRKKWIFYPPTRVPPGVQRSADGADVTVPISTSEWLLTFWSYHLEARHDPDISQRPLEAIAEEGDLFFVPHGWWHMVVNLDFSLALTQNYVSTSNLSDCLRFLRDKRDQVSGVRDRSDALQPEVLYEEFVQRLLEAPSTNDNNTTETTKEKHIPPKQVMAHLQESYLDFDINRDAEAPTLMTRYPASSNETTLSSTTTTTTMHADGATTKRSAAANSHAAATAAAAVHHINHQHRRRRVMKTQQHYANNTSSNTLAAAATTATNNKRQNMKRFSSADHDHDGNTNTQSTRMAKRPRSELCAIFADHNAAPYHEKHESVHETNRHVSESSDDISDHSGSNSASIIHQDRAVTDGTLLDSSTSHSDVNFATAGFSFSFF